jgi:hypothetical protein
MKRRCSALLALTLAAAVSSAARAEPARRVVLVAPETVDDMAAEALTRVRGELRAARFEVVNETAPESADRRAAVERAAGKRDASAALGIFFAGNSAEIWARDALSGRTAMQSIPLDARAPARRAAVLAVKAVDLLEVTMADLPIGAAAVAVPPAPEPVPAPAPAPPPPPATVAPPPVAPVAPAASVEQVVEPPSGPRTAIGIAAGFGWLGVGKASSWSPVLALAVERPRFAVRLVAAGLGPAPSVATDAGSARIGQSLGLAELVLWRPIGRYLEASAAAGAGVLRVAVDGAGAPGFQGASTTVWSPVGGAGGGLGLPLGRRVRLAVEARVLATGTSAEVRIDGQEVARVGRPVLVWVTGGLGVAL